MSDAETRIAALERELSEYRKGDERLIANPKLELERRKIPLEHFTKVLMGQVLGPKAPQEWQILAATGPQYSELQSTAASIETLGRQFNEFKQMYMEKDRGTSFDSLIADSKQYPNLARVAQHDTSFIDRKSALADSRPMSDIFKEAEERAKRLADGLVNVAASAGREALEVSETAPASVQTAEPQAQSVQSSPTPIPVSRGAIDRLPGIGPVPTGPIDDAGLKAMRDEMIRKYARKEKIS